MMSRLETVIHLLHASAEGALASHSASMPGYPFASALPVVPDAHHRPVFLISALAEHSRNLAADARASLLVFRRLADGEMARVTLLGRAIACEDTPALVARYLRYHPEADRFLQLGDFRFHRLEVERMRVVGGFAQAGWLEGQRLANSPALPAELESALLQETLAMTPGSARVAGVDCYGFDLLIPEGRQRIDFADSPVRPESVSAALQHKLTTFLNNTL